MRSRREDRKGRGERGGHSRPGQKVERGENQEKRAGGSVEGCRR